MIGWVQMCTTLRAGGMDLEEFHTLSILEDRGEVWLVQGDLSSYLASRSASPEGPFELQKDDPGVIVARIGNGPLIRNSQGKPAA